MFGKACPSVYLKEVLGRQCLPRAIFPSTEGEGSLIIEALSRSGRDRGLRTDKQNLAVLGRPRGSWMRRSRRDLSIGPLGGAVGRSLKNQGPPQVWAPAPPSPDPLRPCYWGRAASSGFSGVSGLGGGTDSQISTRSSYLSPPYAAGGQSAKHVFRVRCTKDS